jgi:hypothetical protein
MAQQNLMSARALTMEEMENVNGGFWNLSTIIPKPVKLPKKKQSQH